MDPLTNLHAAISSLKAQLAEVTRVINLPPVVVPGRFWPRVVGGGSKLRLQEKKVHLELQISELESELRRVSQVESEQLGISSSSVGTPQEPAPSPSAASDSARSTKQQERLLPNYRSPIKRAILTVFLKKHDAKNLSNAEVCRAADDFDEPPDEWQKVKVFTFERAYELEAYRDTMVKAISKVRADLRKAGWL